MHKRLATDLVSLAHEILQMKNKDDVFALLNKAKEVHEKLSVLAFVEEYVNTTPNLETTKEELVTKITDAFAAKEKSITKVTENEVINEVKEEKVVYNLLDDDTPKPVIDTPKVAEITEQPFDELEEILFEESKPELSLKNDNNDVGNTKILTLEDELKDTVSVDITATLFDDTPKSLNDKLSKNIQIGLNDRIAFVKNLFDNSHEDYNRVISQLNSFKNKREAKKFIVKTVKPDYDWSAHEELENRFMDFIERKFD